MATTKIHAIKSTVGKAIKYICNEQKTDHNILISSYGCGVQSAEMDLVAVKKEVEEELATCGDKNQQAKLQKRINVFNKFIRSGE